MNYCTRAQLNYLDDGNFQKQFLIWKGKKREKEGRQGLMEKNTVQEDQQGRKKEAESI